MKCGNTEMMTKWHLVQTSYLSIGRSRDENHEMSECQMADEVTLDCIGTKRRRRRRRSGGGGRRGRKEKAKNKFLEGASKEQLKKRCRELMEEAASMKKTEVLESSRIRLRRRLPICHK